MSFLLDLGVLRLDLQSGPSLPTDWDKLTLDKTSALDIADSSRKPWLSIVYLFKDPGVGLEAEYKRVQGGILVRISIVPSDSPGSIWKRTADSQRHRATHLDRVFYHLTLGWDELGIPLMSRTLIDDLNMAELYAAVPSPPKFHFERTQGVSRDEREVQLRLNDYEEPEGIQTRLYQYQFRSVARMLQMETKPGKLFDPNYTQFEQATGGSYFVNLTRWDIQRHPGWYQLPRGGILCEQMGVGKTLMCLTLVVATLSTPPSPPADALDISPALTSHTLERYPFETHTRAREELGKGRKGHGIPSLAELCASLLNSRDVSARRYDFELPKHLADVLQGTRFYYDYSSNISPRDLNPRVQVQGPRTPPKKVYLANTTLIIVPKILLEQWRMEIRKHVVEGTLKVLQVDKEQLPLVAELVTYDIILIDVNRFGQEESLHRSRNDLPESELTKARWKRIILDEGHVAKARVSNAMILAKSLSIERRWIVSGTPTAHLQQGGEVEIETAVPKLLAADPGSGTSTPRPYGTRAWTSHDKEDASRIGIMIGGFLAAQPFRSEIEFKEHVHKPLCLSSGPRFGAVQRLKYIMGELMVKHAPKVIDEEASLPPSTFLVEKLDFHPMQRITYNVLTALIASNVYTSAHQDMDYFLHPSNKEDYNLVIRNLHLATFWYSASEMDAQGCLDRTRNHLETNKTLTSEGRRALEEAVKHLETALSTPGWEEWMTFGVSIPFDVSGTGIPDRVRDAWSDSMDTFPDNVDVVSLMKLRDLNRPGRTVHEVHLRGWESRAVKHQEFYQQLEKVQQRALREERKHALAKVTDTKLDTPDGDEANSKANVKTAAKAPEAAGNFRRKASSSSLPKNKNKELAGVDKQLDKAAQNAAANSADASAVVDATNQLGLGVRPLPLVIRTKSQSAKVNRVIQSVVTSEPDDKFVIFGDVFELGHVTEALDLLDINSCYAGHSVSSAKRIQALKDFEDPDTNTKVCLLDLKLGARGLNLVIANRMIFLAPIWSLDVQAQAIKRVHRIGQRRATKVEVLVTSGTFEEDIASRAQSARSEKEEQVYSRALIERPRFVDTESDKDEKFAIRFTPTAFPPPPPMLEQGPSATLPVTPTTPTPVPRLGPRLGPRLRPRPRARFASPSIPGSPTVEQDVKPLVEAPKRPRVHFEPTMVDQPPPIKKRARVAFA